ncbi:OmpA family protein [Variovorax sp. J22R24]|uniref:OmpA family protein n=1 Tax=Variovorax gracilis TaxID=3053502 RepID=UPI002575E14E|nr:OmpA family protein [Variovorax sp. J22R24]MDM0106656.1 OmpA family protein [Variovorax sp. J22R24]
MALAYSIDSRYYRGTERCEEGPPAPVAPAPVEPKTFTLSSDALFAFGKSDYAALKPEGHAELARVASEIKSGSLDAVAVQVRGHADPIGSAASNLRLSEQRARTVSRILAEQGIPANRITIEGVGSAEPVVSCKATGPKDARVACNAPNRRVEVIARGAK